MRREAYAKINRYLKITGKREDGYHLLDTVMQTISLHDILEYEKADIPFVFHCDNTLLENDDNLCVRAANLFFEVCSIKPQGRLQLNKSIPFGAGLGGGSADAAATLMLLNEEFGFVLSEAELQSIAVRLGADVPFCLHGGKAHCEGIGEIMTPCPDSAEFLVVAKGQGSLSTAEMYRAMDREGTEGTCRNDFEPVAERLLPEILEIKTILKDSGACEVQMSGSGSAVYGIFKTYEEAERCTYGFDRSKYFVQACKTVSRY